jgi:hypothetical protein
MAGLVVRTQLLKPGAIPTAAPKQEAARPDRPRVTVTVMNIAEADEEPRYRVERGSLTAAKIYYADIAPELNLSVADFSNWRLESVAAYLGYPGLAFGGAPCEVTAGTSSGEVLVLRYFAPKTSSIGNGGHATEIGWRQIVRLRPRPVSDADRAGIENAYVLLNYQQRATRIRQDPFASPALYTQVMFTRSQPDALKPAYWIVFDRAKRRTAAIQATFDGGDAAEVGQSFHVPDACGQCHGGDRNRPSLNLFDLGQWKDRTEAGDPFGSVLAGTKAELFDAGNCGATPFQTVRTLNAEVLAQNKYSEAPAFVIEAIESWLQKHQSSNEPLPAPRRGYGPNPWDSSHTDDVALLTELNRQCYRCHGTIKFDIFNRSAVINKRARAVSLIRSGSMPLDRKHDPLSPGEKQRLVDMLMAMK